MLRPASVTHHSVKGSFLLDDFVNSLLNALFARDICGDGNELSGIVSLNGLEVFSNLADVNRIDFRRVIT